MRLRDLLPLIFMASCLLLAGCTHQCRPGRCFDARALVQHRLVAVPASASVLQLAMQIESGLGDMVAARRYSQRLQTEFPPAANANSGAGKQ